MEKNPQIPLQEIMFGSSDKAESKRIKLLEKQNIIRRIAPRIYTSNFVELPQIIIRRNWYRILSRLYPGALMSHRSALEFRPTPEGHLYVTYSYTRINSLPGLTIHFLEGPTQIKGDTPFFENLYVSQEARAFLENMQESRTRSTNEASKALSILVLEERLDLIIRTRGESVLNQLRDQAREIALELGMEKEYKKLNAVVSSLLATGDSKKLHNPLALARALGEPFDPDRIGLFEILYGALADKVFPDFADKNTTLQGYRNFAFFESYFSNYIEGTEFAVSEARQIITTETPIPARDEDSHDILGTYQIVADRREMSLRPTTANAFIDLLRQRHAVLLRARLSKKPGQFKDINNRAGNTDFVDWTLVTGTLKKGFEWVDLLQHPFAKAAYMMFIISEIHPFLDGNGRIARIMMNVELSSRGFSKIIIPTVYREDYMGALRKLTRQRLPEAYIRMLARAYEFSSRIYDEDMDSMEHYLRASNAFLEPEEGKLLIISH